MTNEEKEELYKEFKERLVEDLISNLSLEVKRDWTKNGYAISLFFKNENGSIYLGSGYVID